MKLISKEEELFNSLAALPKTAQKQIKGKGSVKVWTKKADIVFSLYIRARDGNVCQWCGTTKKLQCAHIVPRTIKLLRWDERNAIALCLRCHLYKAHKDPILFHEFLEANFRENYSFVQKERYKDMAKITVDYLHGTYDRYSDKLKGL